ncbi:Signal transduction histidine kinase [Dethiosulfatibacter aminovorans DSM 17477]|uniref:histidine kinase n=1 Tax=Dethiosulfatibacter aminovorans DSM 17477 TaxID=1121476 RepID=A0A1M6GDM9_9FIRM|nr:HAMP domain-containing sensor histidine kinase [Dethiosulfatibacter aminovorans]SHJ08037.1 Signal transduction histidine kinase [Dethiosulfatibacter aminovorans DSM 17477]
MKSISSKVLYYFICFALVIFLFIGLGLKFVLPQFYLDRQMDKIAEATTYIKTNYGNITDEEAELRLEGLREDIGGNLYILDETGELKGYGYGKNRSINQKKSQFVRSDDITEYQYINDIGIEIYAFGVQLDNDYLAYEVSIQSLDKAVDTMFEFSMYLLVIALVLSVLIALLLAGSITRPIKKLNKLALEMRGKGIDSKIVATGNDEINQLNQSINSLYEELLSNIYKLESELKKERNSELLKKKFLAQATHELKTPISVIQGYSELVYDGMYKDLDERDHYVKSIYDETKSMSHIINDILDYSKMETGNFTMKFTLVELKGYLDVIFNRFKDIVEKGNIEFKYDINFGEFSKSIDEIRIEQVIKNLLSNAIEHSDGRISVMADKAGDKLRLEVFNSGDKIADEDIPYIFDSFYKKKGKKKGTGLGLAIVKEIVTLHKGDYRVENREDGVSFIVVI